MIGLRNQSGDRAAATLHTARCDAVVVYIRLPALASTRPPGGNTTRRSGKTLDLIYTRPHTKSVGHDGGTFLDVVARRGHLRMHSRDAIRGGCFDIRLPPPP